MPELKPCPFCGGEAELEHIRISHSDYSRIRCVKCIAKTELIIKSFTYSSDERAAEAWNRRDDNEN